MTLIELALKLRPYIEQAAQSLDDQTASDAAALFPRLKQDGALVEVGTRINWNGTVKRAADARAVPRGMGAGTRVTNGLQGAHIAPPRSGRADGRQRIKESRSSGSSRTE